MNITSDALLTDLYELTMAQAYLAQGMTDIAVFEFFVRKLPPQRNFFMAAGQMCIRDSRKEPSRLRAFTVEPPRAWRRCV